MHGHLVTVKVCVKSRTNQGVNTNSFSFNQDWLKCKNGKPVKRRGTVKKHCVATSYLFQHVPYFLGLALNQLLGRANGMHIAKLFQTANNKRLKKNQRHFLGQSALVYLQLRSNHNHRAARVIDTLAQKVLPKASTLALEHIAQRFQVTIANCRNGTPMAAIVQQSVHSLLQHPLFISNNHFWCFQVQQIFQTVVAVNNTPIQIIQVRSRKAAPFQWN